MPAAHAALAPHADSPGRGRPREFDVDEVLDKAIAVFCERGYHATSIGDLTAATGLASGSVYKAFGDKRGLYIAALDRYKAVRDAELRAALAPAPDGRARVRVALTHYAEASHGARGRLGCFVVGSAAELATFDDELSRRAAAALRRNETLLTGLLREGRADGSIPDHVDPEITGRLLLCLIQGMRVVGKTGTQRKDMLALVDIAMKTVA
ncbi:MAG TPA: TetR/AcrR family transcriptional regulator [Burkholderiaceae bacterium]